MTCCDGDVDGVELKKLNIYVCIPIGEYRFFIYSPCDIAPLFMFIYYR
jgi:hypothetical protein